MDFVIGGLVAAVVIQFWLIHKLWDLMELLRRSAPEWHAVEPTPPKDCCDDVEALEKKVKVLYDWSSAVGFNNWIKCVNNWMKGQGMDCGPGQDPNWPPKDPPDFPV
jgi:hypothetical protein